MSIEDPRVAQGGALKGCPICGGTLLLISRELWLTVQVLATASPTAPSSRRISGVRLLVMHVLMAMEVVISLALSALAEGSVLLFYILHAPLYRPYRTVLSFPDPYVLVRRSTSRQAPKFVTARRKAISSFRLVCHCLRKPQA